MGNIIGVTNKGVAQTVPAGVPKSAPPQGGPCIPLSPVLLDSLPTTNESNFLKLRRAIVLSRGSSLKLIRL